MSPIFVLAAAGEFIIVIGARLSVSGCNFAQFPGSRRRKLPSLDGAGR